MDGILKENNFHVKHLIIFEGKTMSETSNDTFYIDLSYKKKNFQALILSCTLLKNLN